MTCNICYSTFQTLSCHVCGTCSKRLAPDMRNRATWRKVARANGAILPTLRHAHHAVMISSLRRLASRIEDRLIASIDAVHEYALLACYEYDTARKPLRIASKCDTFLCRRIEK